MLEEIKEVLISEKQQELHRRQQIDKEIKELIKARDLKQQQAIQTLSSLETEMEGISSRSFNRIFHSKQIKELCTNYTNVSNNAIQEIKQLNAQIDDLYQQIHDLSHDEVIIEREIERIRQAVSLQELGLNERTALQYIKNDEKKVIRAVFKDIKDNYNLETSADIERNLNELYQVNLSPFVVAMQKTNFNTLVQELIDIGIIIDEDKVKFLKSLTEYVSEPNNTPFPVISHQDDPNYLDNYFYNQAGTALNNMNRYATYPPITITKIITLAVLVSMAKTNKKEQETQK